jgi:hypothetical protein
MGGFKPIGSEKLEGMDKIRRIMEIARYNENIPQPVNETKSTEYSIDFADGNTYRIEKERNGYIIKMAINESETDYIEPMKSRKYYSSYSSALKRLNLMAKEINVLHENEEGISLIGEQKKKFILKTKKKKAADEPAQETPPPAEPASAPEPLPAPPPIPEEGSALPPPPTDMGAPEGGMEEPPTDMGAPEGGMEEPPTDMGTDEGGMEEPEMGVEDEEEDIEIEKKPKEKKVSDLKRIQILVGKLAQKIRTYEEDKELSPKEIKYIINSILSAIDVEVLDEDDIEQIIAKLEGTDEDEGDDEEEDVTFDETKDEEEVAPEPPTEPEMAEGYDNINDAFNDYFGGAYAAQASKALTSEMGEGENGPAYRGSKGYDDASDSYTDVEEYHKERRKRHFYPEVDSLEHGTFSESSVDKVLSKYFILNESEEKKYQNTKDQKTNHIYNTNKQNIVKLAESAEQLSVALEYIKENQRVKLLGLSNKGNLIFKEGINEVRITKSGKLI